MSTHSLLSSGRMFLWQVVLSEESQKVKSLLCLLDSHWGVRTPQQVLLNLDAQEPEVRDPLHIVSADAQWLDVSCFLHPEVHDQLLRLGGVKDQVIFRAPPSPLLHLRSESHYCGVICRLNSGVAGVGRGVVISVEGVELSTQPCGELELMPYEVEEFSCSRWIWKYFCAAQQDSRWKKTEQFEINIISWDCIKCSWNRP